MQELLGHADVPTTMIYTHVLNRGWILLRNDLVIPKKPRRKHTHPGRPLTLMEAPNATWTTDFKGEFRTGDGTLCYPLTVQDGHSRFLLDCHAMERLDIPQTRRRFELLFHDHGLPERIRSDNGHPFASTALGGLSQLSVWNRRALTGLRSHATTDKRVSASHCRKSIAASGPAGP